MCSQGCLTLIMSIMVLGIWRKGMDLECHLVSCLIGWNWFGFHKVDTKECCVQVGIHVAYQLKQI